MKDIFRIGSGVLSVSLMLGISALGGDDGIRGGALAGDEHVTVFQGGSGQELTARQIQINNALDATPGDWRGSFDETPISDVVAYLRGELERRGLGAININYNPPSQSADAAGGSVPEPTVTVMLSGVTLREMLTAICRNAGCVFYVTDSGIEVYMQNDPASEITETRVWCNVPPSFFPGVDAGGTGVEMAEYLMRPGLKLDVKGSAAYYDPRLDQLTVTASLGDSDIADAFIYAENGFALKEKQSNLTLIDL